MNSKVIYMTDRTPQTTSEITIIKLPEVIEMTGLSRTTIYRRIEDDDFPKPIKLGKKSVRNTRIGFSLEDVQAWLRERHNR